MRRKLLSSILVLVVLCGIGYSQDYYTDAQKQLMARRAAIVDGYRQLAETIKGVSISSTTKVVDFVTVNDEISADMEHFIVRGAQVTATRYRDDGICEVDMVVNVHDLVKFLQLAQRQYQDPRWKDANFAEIARYCEGNTIKATGTGAPPGGMSTYESKNILSENQSMREQIAQLTLTVQQLTGKLAQAEGKEQTYSLALEENNVLKAESERLRASQLQFSSQAGAAVEENKGLKQRLGQLESENRSLQNKMEQMARYITEGAAYKQKYETSVTEGRQIQSKLSQLEGLLATSRNEALRFQDEIKSLQATSLSLQTSQKEGQQAAQENAQLKQKNQELDQAVKGLNKQMQEMQNMFVLYSEYKVKYEEYVKKHQDATQEISALKAKLQAIAELREKTADLQAKLDQSRAENERLRQQLAGAGQLHDQYREESAQRQRLAQENSRLSARVKSLETALAEKNNAIAQLEAEIAKSSGAWVAVTPQQKLMARRAAILDGYRQLLETLEGVRIDSSTTVKDFVTVSDEVKTAMQGYIHGAQVTSTRYLSDGTCEVDVQVELNDYVAFLKKTAKDVGLSEWKDRFGSIKQMEQRKVIQVTGTGTFKE